MRLFYAATAAAFGLVATACGGTDDGGVAASGGAVAADAAAPGERGEVDAGGRASDAAPGAAADGGTSDAAAPGADAGGDAGRGGFAHPGIHEDRVMLDFVKAKVAAGEEPWKSALAAATASRFGKTSYAAQPVADVVCGPYSNPDVGCSAEKDDAAAAYTHALLWYLTGDPAHAAKAIEIMNAWSAVLKEHTDSNAPLQSAWVSEVFPRAAEIIRWSNAGWAPADEARFEAMLRNVYLPEIANGAPKENGNWELSMIDGMMNVAVFTDDAATFTKAVAMWRARVPAYVYLTTDGPTPVLPPGGAVKASGLAAFWYGQTMLEDGVAQETCRDLGHVQYGLAAMVNAAETARLQGVDLYAAEEKRIVAALELHAGFLNGGAVPSWLCGGKLNAVTPDPMWEVAANAYATRLGAALPNVQALVAKISPTGVDHHMEWETLTHAELGNVGLP